MQELTVDQGQNAKPDGDLVRSLGRSRVHRKMFVLGPETHAWTSKARIEVWRTQNRTDDRLEQMKQGTTTTVGACQDTRFSTSRGERACTEGRGEMSASPLKKGDAQ